MTWHRNRKLVLGDRTTVTELAQQMEVSVSAVVRVAFEKVGLLVVVTQILKFEQADMDVNLPVSASIPNANVSTGMGRAA